MNQEDVELRRAETIAKAREHAARMGATELLAVYELPGGGVVISMSTFNIDAAEMFIKGTCVVAAVAMAFQQAVAKMAPGIDVDTLGSDLMEAATEALSEERPRPGSYIKIHRAPEPAARSGLDPDPSES